MSIFVYGAGASGTAITINKLSKPLPKIMTLRIDLSNSNPATCCTYADDAVGMTPGSDEWDEFFGHYPVLFKNGQEVGKLNPNNFGQFIDGSSADITSGSAGDVMIAFPRRGLRISTEGDIVTVSMTESTNDSNFEYNAHTRGSSARDKFYLGAYKGYYDGSKLRSLSGKVPTSTQAIDTFRTQAQANGTGYEQSGFYQLTYRQCMYLLKYANLNSQSAIGLGYTNSSNSAAANTGGTNTWGMDCQLIKASNPSYMTDGIHQVKCLGLEDFWGNIYEWIDGLYCDSSRNILVGNDAFNDTGSGYANVGSGGTSDFYGYIIKPQGTTKGGFIVKTVSGSTSTYFSDYVTLCSSTLSVFGGVWYVGSTAGAFHLNVAYSASSGYSGVASRLMYL